MRSGMCINKLEKQLFEELRLLGLCRDILAKETNRYLLEQGLQKEFVVDILDLV